MRMSKSVVAVALVFSIITLILWMTASVPRFFQAESSEALIQLLIGPGVILAIIAGLSLALIRMNQGSDMDDDG